METDSWTPWVQPTQQKKPVGAVCLASVPPDPRIGRGLNAGLNGDHWRPLVFGEWVLRATVLPHSEETRSILPGPTHPAPLF